MKFFLLATTLFVSVYGLVEHEQWTSFKQNHVKVYNNIIEEKLRFQIFSDNLKQINEHNEKYKKGEVSFSLAINKFADMTDKEFREMLNSQLPKDKPQINKTSEKYSADVPDSIDWREKGAVTPVMDQDMCGSAYAFSAIGAVEGQNAIKNNQNTPLSIQEMLECGDEYKAGGCNGAWPYDAMTYIINHGIETQEAYPYQTFPVSKCHRTDDATVVKITGYERVEQTEEALKTAVGTIGPISICMDGWYLRFYHEDIFYTDLCSQAYEDLDHCALVVGYGTDNGVDYWLVKNSWGTNWGEDGYFRIRRQGNVCGMLNESIYPTL